MLRYRSLLPLILVSAFLLLTGCREERSATVPADSTVANNDIAAAEPSSMETRILNGEHAYLDFCATCHGVDGRGNGPVAEFMTVPMPDLTLLEALNNGVYPSEEIYNAIEGNEDVRAHGSRDMPVWGNVWGEVDGEPVRLEFVQDRINELVEYIRTLQRTTADTLGTVDA